MFCKKRHAHPELSHHGEKAAQAVAKRLEASGYAVMRGVASVLINSRGSTASTEQAAPNAIGVWIKDLPITPEKILNAIRDKRQAKKTVTV